MDDLKVSEATRAYFAAAAAWRIERLVEQLRALEAWIPAAGEVLSTKEMVVVLDRLEAARRELDAATPTARTK